MAKTRDAAVADVSERLRERAGAVSVDGLQRLCTDVDYISEKWIALSLALGRRHQSSRIELVRDENVIERLARPFEVNVTCAVADELLLAVGPN